MVALQLYTAISITKVIAAHAVATEATTIITSVFLYENNAMSARSASYSASDKR